MVKASLYPILFPPIQDPLVSLFQNGAYKGFLFDNIGQQAFQNIGMTEPCTTDGQSCAALKDRSGSGNNATQATTAGQPTFKAGNPDYLSFDGSNDLASTFVASGSATIAFRAKIPAPTTSGQCVLGAYNDPTAGVYLGLWTDGTIAGDWATGAWSLRTSVSLVDQDVIAILRGEQARQELWVAGELAASASNANANNLSAPLYIGSLNNTNNPDIDSPLVGLVYRAFAINRYVTDAEVQTITNALGAGIIP